MRSRLSRVQPWTTIIRNQTQLGEFHAGLFNRSVTRRTFATAPYERHAATNIRQFVQRNKQIPEFYRDITANPNQHQAILDTLVHAVNDGKFSKAIFDKITNNPDCLTYLLYLLEHEKISYWPGITLYQYVMAAAQFMNKPGLSSEDADVRSLRNVKLKPMASDGKLTLTGKMYLERLARRLKDNANFILDINEAAEFILQSPHVEQYLLKIECGIIDKNEDEVEDMLVVLKMNIPLFQENSTGLCSFPPASFMNFVFAKMSANPVKARPVLGRISESQRDNMRYENEQPVAFYLSRVKNNIHKVHRRRCGGFPAMMHDWAHTYWANTISPADREMIMHRMIPALRKTQSEYPGTNIHAAIDRICHGLLDFDLSGSFQFEDVRGRLYFYVLRILDKSLADTQSMTTPADDNIIIACLKKFVADEIASGKRSAFLRLTCVSLDKHAKMSAEFPDKKIYMNMSRMYTPKEFDSTCFLAEYTTPSSGVALNKQ